MVRKEINEGECGCGRFFLQLRAAFPLIF